MESPPPTIDYDQPINQRIPNLLYDVKCLLVTNKGKIAGIIAKIDVIKRMKNESVS